MYHECVTNRSVKDDWCDGLTAADGDHGVAVRRRFHADFHTDTAGSSRAVIDHDLLVELLRKFLRNRARNNVVRPAGAVRRDNAHRAARVIVCGAHAHAARDRDSRNRNEHVEIYATAYWSYEHPRSP